MTSPKSISKFQYKLSLLPLCKFVVISGFILFPIFIFLFTLNYQPSDLLSSIKGKWPIKTPPLFADPPTDISHIVFGIVGSMNTWKSRRHYSESWWRPNVTRGYVFFERAPSNEFLPWSNSSPPFRVNEDISKFKVYRRIKSHNAVRIFRSVMEILREGDRDVRWYVMGDDDTVLFVDNLVKTLGKYDHNKYWYIGMSSECTKMNEDFSFDMAYGGGGYALSYPLVQMLATRVDGCIEKYPHLVTSDLMLYICLADLGVSVTHEKGFHQMDLQGDAVGLLSYHPQTPLLSLHHLDYVSPIFPEMPRLAALKLLMAAGKADQSRLLQQTICYHRPTNWTFSMSWGYSAHIYESILPRSYLKRPLQTFWGFVTPSGFMFDVREAVFHKPCEAPHMLFFESLERNGDRVVSTYVRNWSRELPACAASGNHSADPISKIRIFSSATIPLEAGGIECCDVRMAAMNVPEITYRPCFRGELMA